MNFKFKHLTVQNVCGLKEFDTDFFERTIIKGANATGKSTLLNAMYWLLTDKMADGTSADVKPRNEDGEEIHNLITMAILTMDADGKEIRAKKTLTENWVKNRSTSENVFKGNENSYEINEIPKKKADFEDYLKEYIDLSLLSLSMNPRVFLNLASKERRQVLFDRFAEDSDETVIATDERFEIIRDELKDGTIDELLIRSRKAVADYKKQLEAIPDELKGYDDAIADAKAHIVELNDTEKESLNSELATLNGELSDLDSVKDTINEVSERISKAKIRLSEIETNARISQQKAEADLSLRKQNITNNLAMYSNQLKTMQDTIVKSQGMIETHNMAIADYERGIKTEQDKAFDENSLSCPTCGRKYPDGKQEKIREHFEKEKSDKIESLENLMKGTKELIVVSENTISKTNEDIQKVQAGIDELQAELAKVDSEQITPADCTQDAEYIATQADIAKWQVEVEKLKASDNGVRRIEINNRISAIKLELGREQTNDNYRALLADLENKKQIAQTERTLELSQRIADQEKMIDLLNDYQRAKIGIVTESINKYFKIIKWRFFRQQINGGWAECCEALVNGISLDRTLNHGDKLLAQLDLCSAFQRKAGITVPLVLDDTESIDSWRIPETDGQLIVIRRTDDKSLIVERLQ